ncbi:MAG UNVERIFIED_CONTAM: AAA family ATPase [Rickettsiaceae bacterium]
MGKVEFANEMTGEEYLLALEEAQKGSCRHRSVLAKHKLYNDPKFAPYQFKSKIITNKVHMFVEVTDPKDSAITYKLDLGGYPVASLIESKPKSNETTAFLKQFEDTTITKKEPAAETKITQTDSANEKQVSLNSPSIKSMPAEDFCEEIIGSSKARILVRLPNEKQVEDLSIMLQNKLAQRNIHVHMIDSPDKMVCSAGFVQKQKGSNIGTIQEGPGGALHDFLRNAEHQNSAIIWDLRQFRAGEVVRNNTAIDDKARAIDGTPVPDNCKIIVLMNYNSTKAYRGTDLDSRFDSKHTPKLDMHNFNLKIENATSQDIPAMNLYASQDWYENLVGRWKLNGDQLEFQEGELIREIKNGTTAINIKNGLWNNPDFIEFWKKALYLCEINVEGEKIKLPENFTIFKEDGYDWDRLKQKVTIIPAINYDCPFILNAHNIEQFYTKYKCDNYKKELYTLDGILKENQGRKIEINLTSNISKNEWARFLAECEKYNVRAIIYTNDTNFIPEEIRVGIDIIRLVESKELVNFKDAFDKKTNIIITDDVDAAMASFSPLPEGYHVFDVSNHQHSDFFTSIKLAKKTGSHLEFQALPQFIENALADNQKIILKGDFSDEFAEDLAITLLERNKIDANGSLIIISNNPDQFGYMETAKYDVSAYGKRKLLASKFGDKAIELEEKVINDHTFAELESMLSHKEISSVTEDMSSQDVIHQRLIHIEKVFSTSPCIALKNTPLSMVNYSIYNEMKASGKPFFIGYDAISNWAKNTDGGNLVINDILDFTEEKLAIFEDLYNNRPSVYVDGQYYCLTNNHKVIFLQDTNFSYDNIPFLNRHSIDTELPGINFNYVLDSMIKPILKNHLTEDMIDKFHKIYDFIKYVSQTHSILSLDLLQNAAGMIRYTKEHYQDLDIEVISEECLSKILRNKIPAQYQNDFDKICRPNNFGSNEYKMLVSGDGYYFTKSRLIIKDAIEKLLELREDRIKSDYRDYSYAGSNVLLLEGTSGAGKSTLVNAVLKDNHFVEIDFRHATLYKPTNGEAFFYRIPASLDSETANLIFTKAGKEGALVIVDEINTTLSHANNIARLWESREASPGFMVIATQNASKNAGRDHEIANCIKIIVENYSKDEFEEIFTAQGLTEKQIEEIFSGENILGMNPRDVFHSITHEPTHEPTHKDVLGESLGLDTPV